MDFTIVFDHVLRGDLLNIALSRGLCLVFSASIRYLPNTFVGFDYSPLDGIK